ncbi:VOC family protein [Candidatus Berkiella aquae]|uniref:3-demethylubiquinone-9 3-methyltransferase n=1 Tax=Candidatus Berkiella aquae TaxID=295108 RepID=A0A0Q9YB46_9GAMM|nr:VOC family protein [Candidatus Berkiella aquae]MCS5710629.1 VOC family protein [Candidatus Berkiella aquae]
MKSIATCLWFNTEALEAATFYLSIFKDGKIGRILHYGKEGFEIHGKPEGSVMVVYFEINGQGFQALNGGPEFKFNEAVSFVIPCESQEEIDYYWEKLTSNGGKEIQCGWLQDQYGVSWQVVPSILPELLENADPNKSNKAMKNLLQMKKIIIQDLQ